MLVWGGFAGARYDPATDSWAPMTTLGAPSVAIPGVWTGSRLIVWDKGGGGRYFSLNLFVKN